jgi:hypothetical protein
MLNSRAAMPATVGTAVELLLKGCEPASTPHFE